MKSRVHKQYFDEDHNYNHVNLHVTKLCVVIRICLLNYGAALTPTTTISNLLKNWLYLLKLWHLIYPVYAGIYITWILQEICIHYPRESCIIHNPWNIREYTYSLKIVIHCNIYNTKISVALDQASFIEKQLHIDYIKLSPVHLWYAFFRIFFR